MGPLGKHWAMGLVIIGLGMDVLDTFTVKAGATGGVLYNSTTGVLKGIQSSIPGKFTVGEFIAIIGALFLLFDGGR